jgi:hypothetical protein
VSVFSRHNLVSDVSVLSRHNLVSDVSVISRHNLVSDVSDISRHNVVSIVGNFSEEIFQSLDRLSAKLIISICSNSESLLKRQDTAKSSCSKAFTYYLGILNGYWHVIDHKFGKLHCTK